MRTRARRGAAQLPLDVAATVLSYLEGGALRCIAESGTDSVAVETALAGFSGQGDRKTVKLLLYQTTRRPLRVPGNLALKAALATARTGDTILVSKALQITETLRVPNIALRIVGARRPRWSFGRDYQGDGDERDPGHWGAVTIYTKCIDDAFLLVEGDETSLTLKNISFDGFSRDLWYTPPYVEEDEEDGFNMDAHDTAVKVSERARVKIDNCAFACFGRMAVFATTGSNVLLQNSYVSRGYFGAQADGAGTSLVIRNCRLIGECVYGALANDGASVEVENSMFSSKESPCSDAAICAQGEGSRIKVDSSTSHARPNFASSDRTPFMVILEDATLTVQGRHLQWNTYFIGEDNILDCMEPKEDGSEWDYIPGDDDWSTLRSSNHPTNLFMLW
jgi:hypothetical protein